MLFFAHTGITLGLGWLIKEKATARLSTLHPATEGCSVSEAITQDGNARSKISLTELAAGMDLRVLIVGSLLPDITDKPLGQLILRQSLNNGRIYSHTLVFFILVVIVGLLLYHSRRQIWVILLGSGTLTHLILDEMWRSPQTLFWPFGGGDFPRAEATVSEWIGQMLLELLHNPEVFIPELAGLVVLLSFSIVLIKKRQVKSFLYHGRIQ